MDLVEAEDQLPASVNPLSLHIMRLTSEYVSGDRSHLVRSTSAAADSDTESLMSSVSSYTLGGKKKKNSVRKFFGSMAKKTTDAAKSLTLGEYMVTQQVLDINDARNSNFEIFVKLKGDLHYYVQCKQSSTNFSPFFFPKVLSWVIR